MAIIVIPNTFSAGAVIVASQHNSNFSTIYSDYNGNIDNTNISSGAAIAYSKLNLSGGIVNADVNASAGIVASKLNLTTASAIGTTSPAAGKFTTLEATSTLKLATTNQGDVLYDNGTSLVRLTPGTSGQFLQTQGAGANPQWANAGALVFVSSTPVAAAATSGNISITATKSYFVSVVAKDVSGGSNTIGIRVNGDTGANYSSGYSGRGSSAAIGASSSGGTSIIPSTAVVGNDGFVMQFYLMQATDVSTHELISGTLNANVVTGGYGVSTFGGKYTGGAPTSFSVIGSGNYTGTVYLYEIKQS